jgi:hypothetical protein
MKLVNDESVGQSRGGDIIESWGNAGDMSSRPLVGLVNKWHAGIAGR